MNESHLIDNAAERRDRFAELLAGLAVRFEVPHGFEPRAESVLEGFDVFAKLGGLAVPLDEFGFEVEKIDVTGAAGHEQLDDALGFRGMVQPAIGALRGIGEELFAAE